MVFRPSLAPVAVLVCLVSVGGLRADIALAADEIGPATACREVRAIMDAAPDVARMQAVAEAVATAFAALDVTKDGEGRRALYARLTPEGRAHAAAAVLWRCGERPGEALGQAVAAVYRDIEAAGESVRQKRR